MVTPESRSRSPRYLPVPLDKATRTNTTKTVLVPRASILSVSVGDREGGRSGNENALKKKLKFNPVRQFRVNKAKITVPFRK